MFIVPVGRENQGQCHYEAVFHRSSPALRITKHAHHG
jgi:hypothetical protein